MSERRRGRRQGWSGPTGRGDTRGQTTHDFAFGISIFLVTAVFVMTFVPGVTTPFATGITEVEQEQSQTAARVLVGNLSAADASTALNTTRTDAFFQRSWAGTDLQSRLGLPETASVNVTLRETDRSGEIGPGFAVGDAYHDQSGSTTVRIVTYDGRAYRMEVVVW